MLANVRKVLEAAGAKIHLKHRGYANLKQGGAV